MDTRERVTHLVKALQPHSECDAMPEPRTVEITRQELYEHVWAKPTSQIARSIGVSDVAIAKACKRHRIPKPPVGYWRRKETGKSVSKMPLPRCSDEKLSVVRFHISSGTETELKRRNVDPITVPDTLDSPHGAVTRSLKKTKVQDDGLYRSDVLAIAVTEMNLGRAHRVFDTLIKSWKQEGGAFEAPTTFRIEDQRIPVRIEEIKEKQAYTGKLLAVVSGVRIRGRLRAPIETRLSEIIEAMYHEITRIRDAEHDAKACETQREFVADQRHVNAAQVLVGRPTVQDHAIRDLMQQWIDAERLSQFADAIENGELETYSIAHGEATKDALVTDIRKLALRSDPTRYHPGDPIRKSPAVPKRCFPLADISWTMDVLRLIEKTGCVTTDDLSKLKEESHPGFFWHEISDVLGALGYPGYPWWDGETKYIVPGSSD